MKIKKLKIALLCFLTITGLFTLVSLFPQNEDTVISDFYVLTQDGCVVLSWKCEWKNLFTEYSSRIKIEVTGDGCTRCYDLKPTESRFVYSDGSDGKGYSFHISIVGRNNVTVCEADSARALLIQFNSIPDLPLITVTTEGYEEPDCDYVSAPDEACMGSAIINNEYVYGNLSLWQNGTVTAGLPMKVKIRGNTSAYTEKKPYKIVLEEPFDLLQRDGDYAYTEWLLLKNDNLNMPVGNVISELCGVEWQPGFMFVNVIFNGDWKGSYLLVEAVEGGKGKLNIDNSGFIIENDAYWWNENGNYFKSYAQVNFQTESGGFGFTYKHLPSKNKTKTKKQIENFINEFEEVLYTSAVNGLTTGEEDYTDYIDVDSFTAWVMAHDLLGSLDFGGSNIFLYKENLIEGNETETKMKIGPLWDFDSNYMNEGQWSGIHITGLFYYPKLFEDSSFTARYIEKWNTVSDTVCSATGNYLNEIKSEYGEAIQSSWRLDAERWGCDVQSLDTCIDIAEKWFETRTVWMDEATAGLNGNNTP